MNSLIYQTDPSRVNREEGSGGIGGAGSGEGAQARAGRGSDLEAGHEPRQSLGELDIEEDPVGPILPGEDPAPFVERA